MKAMIYDGKLTREKMGEFIEGLNKYPFPGKPADYEFYYETLPTKIRICHRYTRNLHPNADKPYYAESVWGFVDKDGNIYKAEGVSKMHPRIRGSVFFTDPYKAHTWMSVRYLK